MTYRKFDTETWNDPWFEKLSIKAKLGFVYFWTNALCNQSGMYEISQKRVVFELGYGIDTIYSEIKDKIYWDKDKNYVWVKNFFRRQCQNSKFAISALNSIKENPIKLQLFTQYNKSILRGHNIDLTEYHIDMVSIPYPPVTVTETEQNRNRTVTDNPPTPLKEKTKELTVAEKFPALCPPETISKIPSLREIEEKVDLAPRNKSSSLFEEFWQAYPRKKSKGQAEKAWKKINPKGQLVGVMLSRIKQAKTSEDWQKEKGKYIPYPATWLNAKGWEDETQQGRSNLLSDKGWRTAEMLAGMDLK